MTTAPNGPSPPRTLTDAVKARQARRGGGDHASAQGSRGRSAAGEEPGSGSSTRTTTARNRGADGHSWFSRLVTPLKRLGRQLLEAFEALAGDGAGSLRKLGAAVAAGMLAKRLPGPLRWVSGLLTSALMGERGFAFWWLVATLGVALLVGALVALLISPVAALLALLVVGIWMLFRRGGSKNDDEDHSKDSGREGRAAREGDLASSPA